MSSGPLPPESSSTQLNLELTTEFNWLLLTHKFLNTRLPLRLPPGLVVSRMTSREHKRPGTVHPLVNICFARRASSSTWLTWSIASLSCELLYLLIFSFGAALPFKTSLIQCEREVPGAPRLQLTSKLLSSVSVTHCGQNFTLFLLFFLYFFGKIIYSRVMTSSSCFFERIWKKKSPTC